MKKTIIALAAALAFAACDKISTDQYVLFAGSVAQWADGTPVATPVQRAHVDKYTGPKCSNCPMADVTLEAALATHGDRMTLIAVNHPSVQGLPYPNEPDLRTSHGTAWVQFYGITGIPAALLNRNTASTFSSSMPSISGAIADAIAQQPTLALEVEAAAEGSSVTIDVNMQFLADIAEPLTLTLALTEDSLAYKQLLPDASVNPTYVHNHMLRDVVTDTWGTPIEAQGRSGECRKATFRYAPSNPDIKLENCHIVALVSYKESRQIVNCAECHISH